MSSKNFLVRFCKMSLGKRNKKVLLTRFHNIYISGLKKFHNLLTTKSRDLLYTTVSNVTIYKEINYDHKTELEGVCERAYLSQVNFYRRRLFEKFSMGYVQTVPENMHVKFEVGSFNRFKLA